MTCLWYGNFLYIYDLSAVSFELSRIEIYIYEFGKRNIHFIQNELRNPPETTNLKKIQLKSQHESTKLLNPNRNYLNRMYRFKTSYVTQRRDATTTYLPSGN